MRLAFEDDGGKTPALEIVVDIPYQKDKYWVIVEDYKIFRRTLYNVEMFRIPEAAYEYLNPRMNESLLAAGLIPPSSATETFQAVTGWPRA